MYGVTSPNGFCELVSVATVHFTIFSRQYSMAGLIASNYGLCYPKYIVVKYQHYLIPDNGKYNGNCC